MNSDNKPMTPVDRPPVNIYDDGNIPDIDLPRDREADCTYENAEPLPESFRPRKDGPGGD